MFHETSGKQNFLLPSRLTNFVVYFDFPFNSHCKENKDSTTSTQPLHYMFEHPLWSMEFSLHILYVRGSSSDLSFLP